MNQVGGVPPISQKHDVKMTGYAKLALGVNACVNLCMVPFSGSLNTLWNTLTRKK